MLRHLFLNPPDLQCAVWKISARNQSSDWKLGMYLHSLNISTLLKLAKLHWNRIESKLNALMDIVGTAWSFSLHLNQIMAWVSAFLHSGAFTWIFKDIHMQLLLSKKNSTFKFNWSVFTLKFQINYYEKSNNVIRATAAAVAQRVSKEQVYLFFHALSTSL